MRRAIVDAVLVDGLSAPQVVELAAAGRLGGLAAFEVAPSTVHWLVSKARKAGVPDGPPTQAPAMDGMRKVAEKTIARVEAMEAPTAKDLHALREAHKMLSQTDRTAPPPPTLRDTAQSQSSRGLIATMQAEHDRHVRAVAAGAPCSHIVSSGTPRVCLRCRQPV